MVNIRLALVVKIGSALTANLYWELNKTQKNAVEYRVVDGGHDWLVFRDSSVSGLPWMNSQCEVLDKGK